MHAPTYRLLPIALALALASPALAQNVETSWKRAKNASADNVYHDNDQTLYCGCAYQSDNDSDGSGQLDMAACGITPHPRKATGDPTLRIEWEHIVPASLMPARQMACWTNPEQFSTCVASSGNVQSGRSCCEEIPVAQKMLFDLHNLAPAIGQLNQYRLNDRYGMVSGTAPELEPWPGCDTQHLHASSLADHRFEPANCVKGDVARIWFYMHDKHGVVIPDAEWNMFVEWDAADPISPWEVERDRRIAGVQGNHNPYVEGAEGDPTGACAWDP